MCLLRAFPEIPFLLGHRQGSVPSLCESVFARFYYNPLGMNTHDIVIRFCLLCIYCYKSQSCNHLLFAKHTLPLGVSPLSGSHAPHTPPPPHSLRDLHSRRGPSQPSQSLWQHLNTVLVTWVRMSLERWSGNPRLSSFLQGTSVPMILSPVHLASATISGRGTEREREHVQEDFREPHLLKAPRVQSITD